jgi:hypothetical protein
MGGTATFGVIVGIALAAFGQSIIAEPLKTVALIAVLVTAHILTKGNT